MSCKGLSEKTCIPPCKYIRTTKRNYCRTSKNKTNVKTALNEVVRKHATQKISKMIEESGKFLQVVCEQSGQCLAFGTKTKDILKYFNGFTDFKYVTGNLYSIGENGNNGFVRKIEYDRNGYKAFSILKSSNEPSADNLMYEYLVGTQFINHVMLRFPCFIQTYGLFFYENDDMYQWISQRPEDMPAKSILQKALKLSHVNYAKACKDALYASILIQYISHSTTFTDTIIKGGLPYIQYHITYVIFILYQALSSLSKVYTHYDLHSLNVLIFQPYKEKFIQYIYHMENETISFKCPYIPKIIDYGRSFFDNGTFSSKDIYEKVLGTPECKGSGDQFGFGWLNPEEMMTMSAYKKNESHDLRLMYRLNEKIRIYKSRIHAEKYKKSHSYRRMEKVLSRLQYGVSLPLYDKMYGTKEDTTLHPRGNIVSNVTDMYNETKKIIMTESVILENDRFHTMPVGGILHVYENGNPMEFIRI